MTTLAWGARFNAEERGKLVEIAAALGCDPSWLTACMAFETGRTFSPSVRNATSGATGLIQFMPSTARGLGTTTDELAAMSRIDQLAYVYAYFKPYAGRLHNLGDAYMAVLWPRAVGQPDDYVIFADGTSAYAANSGLDISHDGEVTRGECLVKVQQLVDEGLRPENVADSETQPAAPIIEAGRPQQPEETSMPGITDTLADAAPVVGTIFGGPLGGLIGGLAAALIKGFQPLAQEKIAKEVARHTSNPETAKQVSTALTDGVVALAQQLTEKADPVEAVLVAKSNPAIMQQIEVGTMARLDELAPFLDKIHGYERDEWTASEDSMDRAAARVTAGGIDFGAILVWWSVAAGSVILVSLMALAGVYAWKGSALPEMLLTLIVQTVTGILGFIALLFAYRFGTSRSSGAKDELVAQLASRRPTK